MKKRMIMLCVYACMFFASVIWYAGACISAEEFNLNDFAWAIERFPADDQIDALIENRPVRTSEDAKKIAETVWFEVFSEDTIIGERPYRVSFDRKNGVWMVSGTLNGYEMGGVANILIRKSDSAVLAVWHDR